ncbi:MAG: hypothetical protein ACI4SK_03650 [Christensenellales bacterium]
MDKIIPNNTCQLTANNSCDIIEISNDILDDTRKTISEQTTFSLPFSQISTLGAGVASILPTFRAVIQTTKINTTGLYKVVNESLGTLKVAKNGNFWGAIKCADGTSKMAQLQSVGNLSSTTNTLMPINPATLMMAVALFSIEKKLESIEIVQKQILAFLETEKESEIEADVEMLVDIIKKYKLNWDNEHFLQSNHKMVLDLQRTARKNMLSYQKTISDLIKKKSILATQKKIQNELDSLTKKFKYYRLSLYTFSLSSLLEVLLSGNFDEIYIGEIKNEIESLSTLYREIFCEASKYLENESVSGLKFQFLNKSGSATEAVGKFFGSIPKIKNSNVDEYLQEESEKLKYNAADSIQALLTNFAEVSSPSTELFTERLQEMILIYNHTNEIFFDDKNLYLCCENYQNNG